MGDFNDALSDIHSGMAKIVNNELSSAGVYGTKAPHIRVHEFFIGTDVLTIVENRDVAGFIRAPATSSDHLNKN